MHTDKNMLFFATLQLQRRFELGSHALVLVLDGFILPPETDCLRDGDTVCICLEQVVLYIISP